MIFHSLCLRQTKNALTFSALQELTKREVEYVSLSRDTTEADLKQRREIRAGSAFYLDQVCCVLVLTVVCRFLIKHYENWILIMMTCYPQGVL